MVTSGGVGGRSGNASWDPEQRLSRAAEPEQLPIKRWSLCCALTLCCASPCCSAPHLAHRIKQLPHKIRVTIVCLAAQAPACMCTMVAGRRPSGMPGTAGSEAGGQEGGQAKHLESRDATG